MKKFSPAKLTSLLLVCTLLVFSGIPTGSIRVSAAESDVTVQSYEDQLSELSRKKEAALAQLDDVRNNRDTQISEAYALDEIIRLNTQQKNLVQVQLDSINQQITEKTALIEETSAKIAEQEQSFLNRMTAHYMEQEVDWIELIFGSASLLEFLTHVDSVNAILRYDREIIEELEANKAILEAEQKALDDALELQKSRVADYENTIRETQAAYDAKLDYIESLRSDEAAWLAEYSRNRALED